jgi:hypothetical protein
MRKFIGILGIGTSLISTFFVVAALVDLIHGDGKTAPSVLAGLFVFFLGVTILGGWLAKKNLSSKPEAPVISDFEQEQRILALANANQGRVTVSEVALHCHLSIADSKTALDRMAAEGVAALQIADDGSFIYAFIGLLPANEKNIDHNPSEKISREELQPPPRNRQLE